LAGGALITGRDSLASAGVQHSALAFGGTSPTVVACTEEYNGTAAIVKSFDYSSNTGITTVSCLVETSAHRYKDNVKELTNQLDKINQLKPVEFVWKTSRKPDIGLIAEEVAEIYPEVVSRDEEGKITGISYSKMVAALIKAIQEQQQQIAVLTKEASDLEDQKYLYKTPPQE
jgi:hypothetical protein